MRLNPLCTVSRIAKRLRSRGYRGLAKWDEQTPWHWQFGRDDQGEDRSRWHEYYFTFDDDEDLQMIRTFWGIAAGTIRTRYRRRVVVAGLLGSYKIDPETLYPYERISQLHHGEWRVVVTVQQARFVEKGFTFGLQKWIDRYKHEYRLHGFYIFALAPSYWRGWAREEKRCLREWQRGRRSP